MKKVFLVVFLISGIAFAASTGYHKTNEIKIGGAGAWDYLSVDVAARRLYVSHQSKVEVIDIDAGKKVGEVLNTAGVHGIAVAPALNKGFTSNGSTNDVTVFDLKTLQPIGMPIKVGTNPDAILFEPMSSRVLAFNARSNNVSVHRYQDLHRRRHRCRSAATRSSQSMTERARFITTSRVPRRLP